jgi:hypothetical protein
MPFAPLPFAQRLQMGAQPVSAPVPIPPPIKGWNTRDQLDAMDPLDAVQLDNWFPDKNGIYVRPGFQTFASCGGSTPVWTLAEYNSGSTKKLLAATNGHIYDATNPASVTSLASGLGSDKWQTVNFLGRTFFMNGTDTMKVYNGSTIANSTFTGVTLSTIIGGWQYQNRLYFWTANSTGFWYAPLNSITGALTFYDLSAFSPNGGNMTVMTNFTHDGSNGVNDFAVFMLSSGDALVYFGDDPGLASAWQLVGRFRLAPPVNPRAMTTYGGDSFATTFDDHVPLHTVLVALMQGQMPPRSKVSTAVSEAVSDGHHLDGWQAIYYPHGRYLLFNIPQLPDKPWCRFLGMTAYNWTVYDNDLYFGGANGVIYKADTGVLDNLGPVTATVQQAWNRMESPNRKRVAAVRPVIQTSGALTYNFTIGFDYQTLNIDVPSVTTSYGSAWDTSPWDISPWSAESSVDVQWRIGGGSGTSVGWGMSLSCTAPVSWLRTDFRVESGNAF